MFNKYQENNAILEMRQQSEECQFSILSTVIRTKNVHERTLVQVDE